MEAAPAQHGQHTMPRPFCGNLHIAIYRHQVAAASHIFVTAKKQSASTHTHTRFTRRLKTWTQTERTPECVFFCMDIKIFCRQKKKGRRLEYHTESLPPAERFTSAKKPQFLDRKANKYCQQH
jgi:hypothetical protein